MTTFEVIAHVKRDALITIFPTIDKLAYDVWCEGGWMRSKLGGAVWIGSFGSLKDILTAGAIENALRVDLLHMDLTFLFVREANDSELEHRSPNGFCWAAPSLF